MAWYWYLLIVYFIFMLVFSVVWVKEQWGSLHFGYSLGVYLVLLVCLPFAPILWIYWLLSLLERDKYETFTIHRLSEGNKETLRQIGFSEGDFVSATNFSYSGFRKKIRGTVISVCNNGNVSVKNGGSLEVKVITEQLKNLPAPTPKAELETEMENE